MYNANVTLPRKRVEYYGITGVPAVFVNGTEKPAVNNPEPGVATYRGQTSPITITIEETREDLKVNFKVTVHSDIELTGKKLHIVACEQHHNYENPSAGTNGEKDFYYIARKAFPDLGLNLNLLADGSQEYPNSYNIASDWNASKMYLVAYIQDDDTKEVLQAGTSLKTSSTPLTIDSPYLKIAPSTEITKAVKINNPSSEYVIAKLGILTEKSMIPAGWEVSFETPEVTIEPNSSVNANLKIKS
jgi:hypothetical protein